MANRKLIELLIDEETENFGVEAISLVKYPAIESNFIHFSKQDGRREMYAMAKVDVDKRTLIGPALIPDKHIPRYDEFSGEEYDVYFSKDTVQQASELFLKNNYANNHTFEHQDAVDGVSVVESWIVSSTEMDKSRHFGLDVPEGTWMVRVHVANDEMWQFVKENKVSGFSIEGYFVDRVEKMSEQKPDKGIVKKIQQMLSGRKFYAEVVTDDGQTFATESDKFEAGAQVYKIGPEGTALDVSNGTYKTKAGTTFEIFDSVVTEWGDEVQQVEDKDTDEKVTEMKKKFQKLYAQKMSEMKSRKEKFSYNGWTNYETWLVSVWGFVDDFQQIAEDDDMRQVTAQWCEDLFEEYVGGDIPRDGIVSDMVRTSISRIDWYDIADHINSEMAL